MHLQRYQIVTFKNFWGPITRKLEVADNFKLQIRVQEAKIRKNFTKGVFQAKLTVLGCKNLEKKLKETPQFSNLTQAFEGLEQQQCMEENPLKPWPENTNPETGEMGGPRGPEPTRYGDWERNGKAYDF
ncbi:hypothetical protein NQ317_005931 [Molorchus minor]|uniref:Succinate dehydrogenase assembly factor 4, mitochondrial n=1 Tax=Molorchus minor TaxID=1323400 RepID=A0ABQ9J7I8_9CUCU|nr:hypothetical protein NQ317_005931 [Molorchus minor]